MTVGEWIGAIGGGITAIGMAFIGVMAAYRKFKTSANAADGDLTVKQRTDARILREEDMKVDSKALYVIINDLRDQNTKLQDHIGTLQNSTLVKIIEAHEEHHECEKKYVALEAKNVNLAERLGIAEKAAETSNQKVRELETRLRLLEGQNHGPTA